MWYVFSGDGPSAESRYILDVYHNKETSLKSVHWYRLHYTYSNIYHTDQKFIGIWTDVPYHQRVYP